MNFQKYIKKHTDAENIILASTSTRHMGSRWYTPDFHLATVCSVMTPRHMYWRRRQQCQLTYRGDEACFRSVSVPDLIQTRYVLLKLAEDIEIICCDIRNDGRLVHNLPAITPKAVTSSVVSVGPFVQKW